jgi:proliferating cell nuclear antigen
MFNTIIDGKMLRGVVDALAPIVDETKVHISPEGINIRATDPGQTMMVAVDLNKGAFDKYEATDMVIAVDIKKISEKLSKFDGDAKLNLFVDEAKKALVMDGAGVKFSTRLLAPEHIARKEPNVPNLNFPVTVTMPGSELKRAIKVVSSVSETVWFIVADGSLRLEGMSADKTDEAQYKISATKVDATEAAKALYRCDFIEQISKTTGRVESMKVEFKNDFPMRLSMNDGGNCTILYFIAPRAAD